MEKVLITGITGFVGSHLAEYIVNFKEKHKIYGICRWRSPKDNLANIYNRVTLVNADLSDLPSLVSSIKDVRPDVVFHLAAQSYVLTSFSSPIHTLWTNVIGTSNLLEAVRTVEIDPVIHVCSCYDEKTEVLTKRGFLKYHEIKENDLVVSIDPATRVINYRPIKKIIIQDYKGPMKHIKTRSVDLLITPNHRLIFSTKPGGDLRFKRVNAIKKPGSRCYFPQGKYLGKTESKIRIGTEVYTTEDIFYLMGLYIGDGYSKVSIKEIANKSGLRRPDFLKFAKDSKGRFKQIRAGKDIKTFCHSNRVFLAIPDRDKARKSAIECLKRLNIKYRLYEREIYFSSKEFVEFFNNIGHSAETKDIPEWVFDYDSKYLKSIYQGLIDSDGYYYGTGERFQTISTKLSESFSKLCLFLGKFATVSKGRSSGASIDGRIIKSRESYIFSISNNSRLIEGRNIESFCYEGKVWCLEIDNTHNFVVRRNGKTVFCGNSSEVYGQVTEKDIPIKETCPFRPASPYAVSKVGEDMLALQYWLSYKMRTIRTRMFSHTGVRRGDVFSMSFFAKQAAAGELGLKEPVIYVGNLKSVRTFCDVRDAVRAYWIMVSKCKPGEVYNIGGNRTMTVGEALEILLSFSKKKFKIEVDPKLIRPSDVTLQIPCIDKFKNETGWEPEIPIEETFKDMLDYWREELKRCPWKSLTVTR